MMFDPLHIDMHRRRLKKGWQCSGVPLEMLSYMRFNNSLVDETGNHTPVGTGSLTYGNGVWSGNPNESLVINSNNNYVEIADSDDFSFTDGLTDIPFHTSFNINFTKLGVLNLGYYLKFILDLDRDWETKIV